MLPVEGMTVHPEGLPLMLDAWMSFVSVSIDKEEMMLAFKEATNLDVNKLVEEVGLENLMSGKAPHGQAILVQFLDWLTQNFWGAEDNRQLVILN